MEGVLDLGTFFRKLEPFVSNSRFPFKISVEGVEGLRFFDPSSPGETYRVEMAHDGPRTLYTSYRSWGIFDLTRGRATLWTDPWRASGAVENFLRALWAHRLLKEGGALLHGAGMVLRGKGGGAGYVFFGPSGAGKTTVARLSRRRGGVTPLSDDLAIVRGVPRRRNGRERYALWSAPFYGGAFRPPKETQGSLLAGLYRLVQAREHRSDPSPPARAAADLVGSMPFVNDDPRSLARALRVAQRIVRAVPCARLSFRKDPGFWGIVAPPC